jgi:hypothetical protein
MGMLRVSICVWRGHGVLSRWVRLEQALSKQGLHLRARLCQLGYNPGRLAPATMIERLQHCNLCRQVGGAHGYVLRSTLSELPGRVRGRAPVVHLTADARLHGPPYTPSAVRS